MLYTRHLNSINTKILTSRAASAHLIEPYCGQRCKREKNECAAGGEASLKQRKRQRHETARQAIHANRQTHASAAMPQGEYLEDSTMNVDVGSARQDLGRGQCLLRHGNGSSIC